LVYRLRTSARIIKEDDVSEVNVQLKLERDTGRYLVGKQDQALFWFDKETLTQWRVEDGDVFILLEEALWKRRLRNARQSEPKPNTRARKCLCCGNPFQAEKGMFVCSPCKRTEAWHMGGTVFAN
jgi:hypothetical protein